ncbi:hypothetical protein GCM10011507_18970 [Edaphobacter acidisoli]|uniref:Prolipoprotein diacylglyceryl transferase n=1 Tax=Edaphobacter acidisoli TaxID=2040573 RepID=A0A916W4Q2_9BACT|nr:prolipoprotein diacylglyceryl transferase family protein [Edaphobacter acidisoli]GGA67629.1 hypothetical protein GCM10011507_18970 [Edaphobacter acidisoli]
MYPYILHSGHLFVPTFGVLAALGLMAGLTLSLFTARKTGLSADALWNAGLFTLLAAFILSRLLLVVGNLGTFLHYPVLLLMVPSLTPLGIVLTIVVAIVYLRLRHLPLLKTLDAWAPCATLIWGFLALGHFAEGSDAGLPTTLPWGLAIPPDDAPKLHPVALYAVIAAAILTVALLVLLRRRWRPGSVASAALVAAGVAQFALTFFRQPYLYSDSTAFIRALDPIQWIALAMMVAAGIVFLFREREADDAV